jgi:hypothetical protein
MFVCIGVGQRALRIGVDAGDRAGVADGDAGHAKPQGHHQSTEGTDSPGPAATNGPKHPAAQA